MDVYELFSGITTLIPSVLVLYYSVFNYATIGCLIHAPFSFMYHIKNCLNNKNSTEYPTNNLVYYKLDTSFILVHSFLAGVYLNNRINVFDLVYSLLVILVIIKLEKKNSTIPILIAFGVIRNSFSVVYYSVYYFVLAYSFWALAFIVHYFNIGGRLNPTFFHLIITIPEYSIIKTSMIMESSKIN
jgi:hypothetical protein